MRFQVKLVSNSCLKQLSNKNTNVGECHLEDWHREKHLHQLDIRLSDFYGLSLETGTLR